MSDHNEQASDDMPITTATFVKWSGYIMSAGGAALTIVWFFAGMSGRQDKSDYRITQAEKRIEEVNGLSIARHEQAERDIELQRQSTAALSKDMSELKVDMARAVAILEQLNKKVGDGR